MARRRGTAIRAIVTEPTSPLQIRDYRFFWLSRFTAMVATTAMVVVIGYQLYDIARSDYGMSIPEAAFQLGLLGLAQFIPLLVLTPVAGLAADRFERRLVAGLAITLDCIIALTLALTNANDALNLPLLYVLAALHGSARVFVGPALSAIAPNIVPPKLIPRAIAFNSIAGQAGSVIGPALGGFLFASDSTLPYATSAGLLVVGCFCITRIRRVNPPPSENRAHPLREMAEGFRFLWNERFLLGCVSLDLFAVILGGATALLPIFARDILQVGPEGLGQMRAAPAFGAALVAIWMSWRPLSRNVGAKMLWAVVVYGACTIGFGLSNAFLLSIAMLTLLGAADMVSVFVRSSLIQLNTPDAMRGRVSAISGLAISASNELGEMQSGVAAALLGATGAVVFGGTGAIVITILWAWLFPELRHARTFAPQYRQTEPAP